MQAGCCPASPRRCRSACHASQARSIRAGVEAGICLVRQNVRRSRSGSARRRRRSARRAGRTAAIVSSPGDVSGARPVVAGAQVRIEVPRRGRGQRPCLFPFGLLQPPCRPRNPDQDLPLPPACPRSSIVTRPSCQPVRETGRCSGADGSVVTGTLTPRARLALAWLPGPGFGERQAGGRRRGRWR